MYSSTVEGKLVAVRAQTESQNSQDLSFSLLGVVNRPATEIFICKLVFIVSFPVITLKMSVVFLQFSVFTVALQLHIAF